MAKKTTETMKETQTPESVKTEKQDQDPAAQSVTTGTISLPETGRPVALPWDVAIDGAREALWVVNAASNDVSVIDISNPAVAELEEHHDEA